MLGMVFRLLDLLMYVIVMRTGLESIKIALRLAWANGPGLRGIHQPKLHPSFKIWLRGLRCFVHRV